MVRRSKGQLQTVNKGHYNATRAGWNEGLGVGGWGEREEEWDSGLVNQMSGTV